MKPTAFEQRCFRLMDGQLRKLQFGHLLVSLPDGTETHYGDDSPPQVIKVKAYSFFPRLVLGGNIGLGEAWTDGDWDSDDLTGVLQLLIHNIEVLKKSGVTAGWAKRIGHVIQHVRNRNTREGSRRNIQAHYDLGNEFYRLFLDHETMLYSAALFESPTDTLANAQLRKLHRLMGLAEIKKDHHILEIGCGWGGFAIEAAKKTGCRVTGITLSEEQYAYAKERVTAENLDDLVSIELCDYRDKQGRFDRIVSIEMLEAVGHQYYGTFFAACDRLLKPGGSVAIQVITIPDQRYDGYRRHPDWIQKHIFPGGMLPSVTEMSKALTQHTSLFIDQLDNIGIHYAETLRRWRKAFEENRTPLLELGYDETFQRKWIYYFCYCEAGFQTGFTNNLHLVLKRSAGS